MAKIEKITVKWLFKPVAKFPKTNIEYSISKTFAIENLKPET